MSFESQEVIKEYVAELNKITELREGVQKKLVETRELMLTTGFEHERKRFYSDTCRMELELSELQRRGQRYIFKIDQLNGVR